MSTPRIELLTAIMLPDFPSGSSINYHQGRFYLIGDDATNILILDNAFNKSDSIHLFDYSEKRISKLEKTDLEGSTVIDIDGKDHLIMLGSASRKNRKRIIVIPFSGDSLNFKKLKSAIHKTKEFIKRIKGEGVEEINLEGITVLKDDLILGNRGNRSNETNHIIVTDKNFWEDQGQAKLLIAKIDLSGVKHGKDLGLSELCYIQQWDILLITFTSEATDNSYDDGTIGDSYIGWVTGASTKIQSSSLMIEGLINLKENDPRFANEKVEGICVESIGSMEGILNLVSDNDKGETRLFRARITIT